MPPSKKKATDTARKPKAAAPEKLAASTAKRRAGHASRRPRLEQGNAAEDTTDGQFVAALARGLEVLTAFRGHEGPLGNQELAERTGLAKPTVSRFTHTLTQLGFLTYNSRTLTYELGGRSLAFAYVAIASVDVAREAKPLMQALADASGFNVGLGVPDRSSMVYTITCEGEGPIRLALKEGSRVPIMKSAMGRAYMMGMAPEELNALLKQLAKTHGNEWKALLAQLSNVREEYEQYGFCTSLGDWHADIHGVAVPIATAPGQPGCALNLGGPAYLLTRAKIFERFGPQLLEVAARISALMQPPPPR